LRRFVCVTMVFLFLVTAVTGFAEAHVHPGRSGIHVVIAVLFVVFALVHGAINRKSLARHFSGAVKKAE
jgi:hypothetical protein